MMLRVGRFTRASVAGRPWLSSVAARRIPAAPNIAFKRSMSATSDRGRAVGLFFVGFTVLSLGSFSYYEYGSYNGMRVKTRLLMGQGLKAAKHGKANEAEAYLKEAMDLAETDYGHDSTQTVTLALHSANMLYFTGQYDRAQHTFKEALKSLLRMGYAQTDMKCLDTSRRIAMCYAQMGDKYKADVGLEYCYKEARKAVKEQQETADRDFAGRVASELGHFRMLTGDYLRAIEPLRYALSILEEEKGEGDEEVVTAMITVSTAAFESGQVEPALELANKAARNAKNKDLKCQALYNKAMLYLGVGDTDTGRRVLEEAMAIPGIDPRLKEMLKNEHRRAPSS
eukprot:Clim_evm64s147 gene=Clim_evmTU64s147